MRVLNHVPEILFSYNFSFSTCPFSSSLDINTINLRLCSLGPFLAPLVLMECCPLNLIALVTSIFKMVQFGNSILPSLSLVLTYYHWEFSFTSWFCDLVLCKDALLLKLKLFIILLFISERYMILYVLIFSYIILSLKTWFWILYETFILLILSMSRLSLNFILDQEIIHMLEKEKWYISLELQFFH